MAEKYVKPTCELNKFKPVEIMTVSESTTKITADEDGWIPKYY